MSGERKRFHRALRIRLMLQNVISYGIDVGIGADGRRAIKASTNSSNRLLTLLIGHHSSQSIIAHKLLFTI
jgi:hypothetical protein